MWIHGLESSPPASSSSTEWRPDAVSRFASTQPAAPAPTTMKSYAAGVFIRRAGSWSVQAARLRRIRAGVAWTLYNSAGVSFRFDGYEDLRHVRRKTA